MSITSLPRELLMLIAYELSYDDILTYRRLNKFFYSAINDSFWTQKYLYDDVPALPSNINTPQRNYALFHSMKDLLLEGRRQTYNLRQAIMQAEDSIDEYISIRFIEPHVSIPIRSFFGTTFVYSTISITLYPSEDGDQEYLIYENKTILFYDENGSIAEPPCMTDLPNRCDSRYILPSSLSEFRKYLDLVLANGYIPLPETIPLSKEFIQRFAAYLDIRED